MDLFGINSTLRKNYPERAHYSQPEGTVNGAHNEITKFANNEILSSAAWSSVIHQPSQDSEPEDLPSTVDIDAIKEPPTPVNVAASQLHGNDSFTSSDDVDSDSDSDFESGNSDNEAENAASGADSASYSDSDSMSSRASSCSSRAKQQSSHSSRSNSPTSNCEDARPQFSVQETNFEQGGLKLKLSTLKVSKLNSEACDDAKHSSDSTGSKLSAVKRRPKHDAMFKGHRMYSLKMRNENRNKISSVTRRPANKYAYESESDGDSSSSNSSNPVTREPTNKVTRSSVSKFASKFDGVLNRHRLTAKSDESSKAGVTLANRRNDLFFRSVTKDPSDSMLSDQSRSALSKGAYHLNTVKLPQACELSSEDSDDSEDIQTGKEISRVAEKLTKSKNSATELEVPNKGEIIKATSREVSTAKHLQKKRKAKSVKQKPEVTALSDSSSDAEMLSKQVVRDVIDSICVDSDSSNSSSDDLPAKGKSVDVDSSSEVDDEHEKKLKGQYSSNLLEVFAEKTDQLNKSSTSEKVKVAVLVDNTEKADEKKKNSDVVRKRGRPPKCKPSAPKEVDSFRQVNTAVSNVSPDSGIQSNSGSPLYHSLHSPSASHSNLRSKSSEKFSSAISGSKYLSLNQKALLTVCKKRSLGEPSLKELKETDMCRSMKVNFSLEKNSAGDSVFKKRSSSFTNLSHGLKAYKNNGACQAENADDTLKVPPYVGSKIVTSSLNTSSPVDCNLTLFQEKRGPGRPRKHEFPKMNSKTDVNKKGCTGKEGDDTLVNQSKKLKPHSPPVICIESAKKGKKQKNVMSGNSTIVNVNGGSFIPALCPHKDWLRKHKKRKKKDGKERLIDVDLLKEIQNLVEVFDKMCVLDNKKTANDANCYSTISRSKIPNRYRERLKKCKVSDKDSESETNSSIPLVITKRRHKKSTAETPKVQEANCDQRLPLKKRHYHISTSSANQTVSDTKAARVEKYLATKVIDEKLNSSDAENTLASIKVTENLKGSKSETSKNLSKGDIMKHAKYETTKSSAKMDCAEPPWKPEPSKSTSAKIESLKNESFFKSTTNRKHEASKKAEDSKPKKSLSVDDAKSDKIPNDKRMFISKKRHNVKKEEKSTSKQTSKESLCPSATLRRSNRSTSTANKTMSKSNIPDKKKLEKSKIDKAPSDHLLGMNSAKKNANLNTSRSRSSSNSKHHHTSKVENKNKNHPKTGKHRSNAKPPQMDDDESFDSKLLTPSDHELVVSHTGHDLSNSRLQIKMEDDVLMDKDVPSSEKAINLVPQVDDSMSLLLPPTLSSAAKEKPRKCVKNMDIDTPPILDEYSTHAYSMHRNEAHGEVNLALPVDNVCSKSQLITPFLSKSTLKVTSPSLKPPVGVFEPTHKLRPSLTKCKKNSIGDVLTKLQQKLKGLESPSNNMPILVQNTSSTCAESTDPSCERVLRPKRSCTNKENINAKKTKLCKDITIVLPILVGNEMVKSMCTKEAEPKPRIKRRKTNRTGFPQLKKKKKLTRYVEAPAPSISGDDYKHTDDDAHQSSTNSSCESGNGEKKAESHPTVNSTIPLIKVETQEALQVGHEDGQSEEMCSASETPPVLTAMHDAYVATSSAKNTRMRADNLKSDKGKTKKPTESDSCKLSTSAPLPSRCSARISIKQQMRDRELKKLEKKEKRRAAQHESRLLCNKKEPADGNSPSKVDGDAKKQVPKEKRLENDEADNVERSANHGDGETKVKEEVDKSDDVSDDSKKDAVPKRRQKFVLAGLFSNYYKEEKSTAAEVKNRFIPYKPEDHEHGLLPPPPYFEDWVRQRRVDFKLPHDLWWLHTRGRLPGRDVIESWKYKRIRMNVYYDVKPPHVYEAQACNCVIPDDKNKLGCGDDCINRVVYAECSPDLCPLKERCSNQRIQKHTIDKKLSKFMTKDKGIGVKTEKLIKAGEYIVEYTGEVVTDKEFKKRMTSLYKNDIHHYCLSLEGGLVIDSHRMGGDGRFVNHSCEPNCEIQKWNVNGLFRMALFARRDIEATEELTYDYNFALFNPEEGQPCYCGSSKCRGVIGGKSQRISVAGNNCVSNVESASNSSISAATAASSVCKKTRVRPRKQIRKSPHALSSAASQRRIHSERSNLGENVLRRRITPCLTPVEPLTSAEKDFVSSIRAFLPRNLTKVQKVREKLRQLSENNENTKCGVGKSKQPLEFSKLLNVLSKQRFIKTRGVAQAEDDPEITRILKLANIFRTIFNFVVSAKDEKDGKPFSSLFMTLPSKEKLTAYCRLIEEPIDLNTIEKNIVNGVYKDAESFDKDMKRLIANNIKYYGRTSDQGIAVVRLRKEYNITKLNYIPQIEEVIGQPIAASFRPVPCDEDEGVIRCICGRSIEEGEMILCDRCLVWQHCSCIKVDPTVEQYHCERCVPREVDYDVPLAPDISPPEYPKPDEKHYLTLMRDDLQIRQGDTVYVLRDIPNPETGSRHTFRTIGEFKYEDCDIFRVEQLWKTESGERFAFGHHYLRPKETFHEPSRRFFPNEVVKILLYETVPLDLIMGRCHVLDLQMYCKGRPVDSDPDHIYICEYRVDLAAKSFFKLSKSKSACSVPTINYAFENYNTRLRPSRTYAPHGDVKPQLKSRPAKTKDCADYNSSDSAKVENQNNHLKMEEDNPSLNRVKDLVLEKRKQRLNCILLKLLAKKSTKAPLDVTYLLDMGRRNRKKTAVVNTT